VQTIPPVTTGWINFWNVNITTSIFTILPTMSVVPPPFVITDTYPPGVSVSSSETRTITPPPWPWSFLPPSPTPTTTTTSTTTTPIALVTYFPPPPFTIHPVKEWIDQPTTTVIDDETYPVIPCKVWFIFVGPFCLEPADIAHGRRFVFNLTLVAGFCMVGISLVSTPFPSAKGDTHDSDFA
jgi:hypothetical protein